MVKLLKEIDTRECLCRTAFFFAQRGADKNVFTQDPIGQPGDGVGYYDLSVCPLHYTGRSL